MKNLISALFVLALVVGGFNVATAQETATADVAASVNATLTIVNNDNVDFGNIWENETATLDPTGAEHENVGTEHTVGKFTIGGSNDGVITIWHSGDVTLSDESENELTFEPDMQGFNEDTQGSAANVVNETGTQHDLSSSGAYYLWLGGSITVPDEQSNGAYTSDNPITVSIEYN